MSHANTNTIIANAAIDIGYFSTKVASMSERSITTIGFTSQCGRSDANPILSVGMNALAGVNVVVDGISYFVGPDATLQTKGRESRTITENFVNTNEYMALFKGGIHYILKDHAATVKGQKNVNIRRLVVGLPLNTFDQKNEEVKEMFEGNHKVPGIDGETVDVTINAVTVIRQPQGAMLNSGSKKSQAEMQDYYAQNLLIIDLGGGTCDWLLSNDRKILRHRSDAYPKGVLACVFAICDAINKGYSTDPMVVQRIDDALRSGKQSFKLNGVEYKTADYLSQTKQVLHECLNQVMTSVGSLTSIDQIIFTGGGGKLLHGAAQEVWPENVNVMTIDDDPVFSNVRGFFLLGMMQNAAS
ncbi:ParM/StbA family protein (plasmid) [Comamonas aquatica]|nr:ParM/StbA family protein [Comamonas aquatica]